MVGLGGKQSFLTATSAQLKGRICRYRRQHPSLSCAAIAKHFGISRQLAHKILREAGVSAKARKSVQGKRFQRFVARARGRDGKQRVAMALGISRTALWRYELPPGHPLHRDMPEAMRERYKALVENEGKGEKR